MILTINIRHDIPIDPLLNFHCCIGSIKPVYPFVDLAPASVLLLGCLKPNPSFICLTERFRYYFQALYRGETTEIVGLILS